MKAQISLLIKGIYLIIVLVIIALTVQLITQQRYLSVVKMREFEFRKNALSIMDKLVGYEGGLAFQDFVTIQTQTLKLSQDRIIDLKKLEEFSSKFSEYEPDSVRNFNFRYGIKVETQPIDLETNEKVIETIRICREVCYQSYVRKCYWVCDIIVNETTKKIDVNIPSESWTFGVKEFSKEKALTERMSISIPVIVYYNKSKLMPAILSIDIADGELEKFSNLIDKSCLTGEKIISDISLSYPVYKKMSEGKNYLCIDIRQEICQRLSCEKPIALEGTIAPGKYRVVIESDQTIRVRI
jgi:hypothetical protein